MKGLEEGESERVNGPMSPTGGTKTGMKKALLCGLLDGAKCFTPRFDREDKERKKKTGLRKARDSDRVTGAEALAPGPLSPLSPGLRRDGSDPANMTLHEAVTKLSRFIFEGLLVVKRSWALEEPARRGKAENDRVMATIPKRPLPPLHSKVCLPWALVLS